jgi:hypothetical protein
VACHVEFFSGLKRLATAHLLLNNTCAVACKLGQNWFSSHQRDTPLEMKSKLLGAKGLIAFLG